MGKSSRKVHGLKEGERIFLLSKFSATEIVSWKCHVDNYTNSRYYTILGRDPFTPLWLDLKFYKNIVIGGEGTYEGCLAPMVGVSNYDFKHLTDKIVGLSVIPKSHSLEKPRWNI